MGQWYHWLLPVANLFGSILCLGTFLFVAKGDAMDVGLGSSFSSFSIDWICCPWFLKGLISLIRM
tara:strand:+ start:473 stop:667 length:195 start_codon:yes stop_codon:yes gene_type:complete